MHIHLNNVGKKYNRTWLFRKLNVSFESNETWGIVGNNGAGKSSLLRLLSGQLAPTEGDVEWQNDLGQEIPFSHLYGELAIASPGMELSDSLTVIDSIVFHRILKPLFYNEDVRYYLNQFQLEMHGEKKVKDLSSGLRQRLKVGLAIMTQSPLLLLDEPCSHLDLRGREWYKNMMEQYAKNRLCVIASNDDNDELIGVKKRIKILGDDQVLLDH